MGTARVQGQRDVALNELPIRGIAINDATANTASVTVYPSDSGIIFVNKFATATTYTLPAVADSAGKMFWFFNVGAGGMLITAPADTLVGEHDAAGTTITFDDTSHMIGVGGMAICDGTNYFWFNMCFTDPVIT